MAEHRMVKRTLLLLAAMLGSLCGFVGLMASAGAILQRVDEEPIFTLSDSTEPIELPCRIEGTDLIARQIVMYEGPYLENGSDTPVSNITALVLYNDGQQEIAQAEVTLVGQEKLNFFASNILPGAQVLVLEENAAVWRDWEITACSGWVNSQDQIPFPEQKLQILEVDMGTVSVTNISGEKLADIWLFYKNYLPEGDLYVGGITYIETVETLEPGQTVELKLPHYAQGYSRILKVQSVT